MKSITAFPVPTNKTAVQQFIGLCNFYRSFIDKFSDIAAPLTDITGKNATFVWDKPQQAAFTILKTALSSSPVLSVYDPSLPIELHTDASAQGFGAILMQRLSDNKLHVVNYWSRKTSESESKYSSAMLECLALVKAAEHFRVYLEG